MPSDPLITITSVRSRGTVVMLAAVPIFMGIIAGLDDGLAAVPIAAVIGFVVFALFLLFVAVAVRRSDLRARMRGAAETRGTLYLLSDRAELFPDYVGEDERELFGFSIDGRLTVDDPGFVFVPSERKLRRERLELVIPWVAIDSVQCEVNALIRSETEVLVRGGQELATAEVLALESLLVEQSAPDDDPRWSAIDSMHALRWECTFAMRGVSGVAGALAFHQARVARAPIRQLGEFPRWERR